MLVRMSHLLFSPHYTERWGFGPWTSESLNPHPTEPRGLVRWTWVRWESFGDQANDLVPNRQNAKPFRGGHGSEVRDCFRLPAVE